MEKAVESGSLQQVQDLIRSGADVNARCNSGTDTMLTLAIVNSHEDIALALLAEGANVHAEGRFGQTALLLACCQQLEEVVQVLVDRGSRVDEFVLNWRTSLWFAVDRRNPAISMCLLRAGASCQGIAKESKDELFHHACRVRDVLAFETLLKNGCSVDTLSGEEQNGILRCACHEGSLLVAGTLLKNGCSIDALSREEQDSLLCCACREGDIFVARALVKARCSAGKLTHTELVQLLKHLTKKEKEGLLYGACNEGDMVILEAVIAAGCNVNCVSSTGGTHLMNAAREGCEEVLKKLILAGANPQLQGEDGNTALHLAARHNHIQCGVLLVEGGASVRTRNKLSLTPLDLALAGLDFQEAIKQALSFTTRKTICIIGNAEGGKSTLIASLQAESNWFLGRIYNRFRRVDDRRKRTAGIETVSHSSQKYGEVLFFDFAGQVDYHGPHQMFLESLLSKPGVSVTLLLVIKVTETEASILHQLHRWLTPVALTSTAASPPHVIVIGSFLDRVKSKQDATAKLIRCMEVTKRDLVELPLQFVGICFLNCRQPQSEGIDQLCSFLQDIPVPEFTATHTGYSLAWVLSKIRSSIKSEAVQLQEFSAWVKSNEDNLPQTRLSPEEVCQDLSAAGYALYLPNREDLSKSWLVLDLPSILHDVYGTLFSRSQEIVQEFGLLHCRHLAELFPDLNLAMVQQLLTSLEFCIPVDPSVLEVELSKLTQSAESSGWLFFPALISTKHSQPTSKDLHKESILCWQLRTSKKHSISARILQTILLRLAAHFVVKQHDEDGVQQHCGHIWWNGIAWSSTVGVYATVHIMKNRVIQVLASSKTADELCQYLTEVISDILSTVHRLSPNLAAAAYIVHPPKMATSTEDIIALSPKQLVPVKGIRNSIMEHKGFAHSQKDSKDDCSLMSIADVFGGHPPALENIERMIWTEMKPSQPQTTEPNQPLIDVSSTPNLRDVDKLVVTSVAANWHRLALRLGVKGCVSEIVFKNHPNDYEGACRNMLDRWLSGGLHTGEEERMWSTLLTALGRAGFVDLERSLRREYFTKE